MDEKNDKTVPQPEGAKDYTRLRERAPEILEASKKSPPHDSPDEKVVESHFIDPDEEQQD